MADSVAGGGRHPHAGQDLGVTVEQLESGTREIEPVGQSARLSTSPFKFGTLYVERGVLEDRILTAVIEVQVSVDHQGDVAWHQIVVAQSLGRAPIDH